MVAGPGRMRGGVGGHLASGVVHFRCVLWTLSVREKEEEAMKEARRGHEKAIEV